MRFLNWDESFATGIPECDIQHKKLINMFNAIYDAIRLNVDKKALKEALDSLINYFEKHFALEEELMEKYEYPEAHIHKEEHKKFKENLNKFLQNPREEINFLEILKFLKNWWLNHILTMDKKYGPFLGIKIKK
jgi:hemerythrin-like metal-binding protein